MALVWTDSIVMLYSDPEAFTRWWGEMFGCKQVGLPDWDNPLPSDIALQLPGTDEPSILLSSRQEHQQAGLAMPDRPILFCNKLEKAHRHLLETGANPGPIQDGGDTTYFEVRDPEGNVIEVCKEP